MIRTYMLKFFYLNSIANLPFTLFERIRKIFENIFFQRDNRELSRLKSFVLYFYLPFLFFFFFFLFHNHFMIFSTNRHRNVWQEWVICEIHYESSDWTIRIILLYRNLDAWKIKSTDVREWSSFHDHSNNIKFIVFYFILFFIFLSFLLLIKNLPREYINNILKTWSNEHTYVC